MRADVFPAHLAPSRLEIPPWVPEPIAQGVRARYAAAVDLVAQQEALRESGCFDYVLTRIAEYHLSLACDRRMKRVWRELSRQRRPSGAFFYQAYVSSVANAQGRQDAAMLELFNTALACRRQCWATTTTRSQAEQQRDQFLTKADELRTDAFILLVQPTYNKEHCQKLADAARAYEDHARELYATGLAMAFERQHDGRARWVALTLSNKFRELFGKPMYGLSSTLTSIVLGREVAPRTVRQWCAVKTQKISP